MNNINECPICTGKTIITLGGNNKVYGLVELGTDGTKSENPNYLPLVVYICQECGHVEFRHYPLDKIKKD